MKIKLFAVLTITASIMFASCGTGQLKVKKLKTEIDSLSYALGAARSEGFAQYLQFQLGIDSTQYNDIIKGLAEGYSIKTEDKKKFANLVGRQIGHNLGGMFDDLNQQIFQGDPTNQLNRNSFIAGFVSTSFNKNVLMDMMEAQAYSEVKAQEIQARQMEQNYQEHIELNQKFLAENKQRSGVITTASGLQYEVIVMGNGPKPTASNTVRVHYTGTLIDGTEFDSSVSRGEPAEFGVSYVIQGWVEALQLMPVGSKFKLYIPENLAYGSGGSGSIQPFSTLIFEVELLAIVQ